MTAATNGQDDLIDIGDGIRIPTEVSVSSTEEGFTVEMTARFDAEAGRYKARSLAIDAQDGSEVTGEWLRTVTVARMVRLATENALAHRMPDWPADFGKAGPTTQTLQAVALIYRLALLLGDAPTQAVADRLRVPRSTAGRWVTRARDRGFLTVVDPRASRGEA